MEYNEFATGVLESDNFTPDAKKQIKNFIEMIRDKDEVELLNILKDLDKDLQDKDNLDIMDEQDHVNGIMFILVQDELAGRENI